MWDSPITVDVYGDLWANCIITVGGCQINFYSSPLGNNKEHSPWLIHTHVFF